jgi:plastocyanin
MTRTLAVLVFATALALGACGDDDAAVTESGSPTGTAEGDAPVELEGTVNDRGTKEIDDDDEVEIELNDTYFEPTFVRGTPGQRVTVELENEGELSHTFTSDALDVDEELGPGDDASVTVTLPDGGTIEFECRFHRGQGMRGAFSVDGADDDDDDDDNDDGDGDGDDNGDDDDDDGGDDGDNG